MKDNVFKCFGISKSEIKIVLSPFIQDNQGVFISIQGDNLLIDIILQADDKNSYFYEISREIYEKFNKYIYAESDISIEQTAFELLKLNNLKIATAESVTAGQIVSSLFKKNLNASDLLVEASVVCSDDAKMRRLGVTKQVLDRYGSVSLETTYDMAKGLLENVPADIVISTTGYASSSSPAQDCGLIFIGIGDRKRIDIYKNRFSGTREEIVETASNAALFYLIKKLRKNDFFLDKNTI